MEKKCLGLEFGIGFAVLQSQVPQELCVLVVGSQTH